MADGDESTSTSGGPRKLLLPVAPGPAQPLTHLAVRFRKKLDASLSSQGYYDVAQGRESSRVAQIKVLDLALHPGLSPTDLVSLSPDRRYRYEIERSKLELQVEQAMQKKSYTKHGEDAERLFARADANWRSTRSTTGFCVFLANAVIAHKCQRQGCIAMSTTEAELVALAQCAIEMIYIISLLKFIGYECKGDVVVETDNKGAWELCHKYTSAQHTRHIDRKLFKLREMRGAGIVKVQYIPTDENTADLFTKVLKRQPFEKHRKVVLNTGAGESTDEVKQQRVAALSAWKTKRVFHTKPQATSCKQTSHLCLRGERPWGETLD